MRLKILGTTTEENISWPEFFFRKEKRDRKREDSRMSFGKSWLTASHCPIWSLPHPPIIIRKTQSSYFLFLSFLFSVTLSHVKRSFYDSFSPLKLVSSWCVDPQFQKTQQERHIYLIYNVSEFQEDLREGRKYKQIWPTMLLISS
jgi:hypothetical protein